LSRLLLALALLVGVAYAGALIWFRANESALLFHPDRGRPAAPPARLDLGSRDVLLSGPNEIPLMARLVPPVIDIKNTTESTSSARAPTWILYFHGASGNIGTSGYNEAWAKFRKMGLGVLAVDYRGFGESGGTPSEAGLYADADTAYEYVIHQLAVAPSRIVIYGYSLGSAVAIDLASRVPAAGLIVEGALMSIPARGAELYPYLPVTWLARNRFASVDKIGRAPMPKLFIHARNDTYVPIAHGRRLFELARPPKYFQEVAGGHTDAFQVDPGFFRVVADFIARVGLPVQTAESATPK
jgi:hypothetical protein